VFRIQLLPLYSWLKLLPLQRNVGGCRYHDRGRYNADGVFQFCKLLSFFLSFFLSWSNFYPIVVGVEEYCWVRSRAHTHTHARTHTHAPGMTLLEELSALPSGRYLHNTQNPQQTSTPPAGFEPVIPASERPQTHVLRRRGHADRPVYSYQKKFRSHGDFNFNNFVLWLTNAQLFHKLSHSYMFRHYLVILRQPVINTLPSYTSISNAAVGNTVYHQDVSHRLYASSHNHSLVFSLRGRVGRNQSPVMWPVRLWHTASWASSWG
jgi:hypothetical protein